MMTHDKSVWNTVNTDNVNPMHSVIPKWNNPNKINLCDLDLNFWISW